MHAYQQRLEAQHVGRTRVGEGCGVAVNSRTVRPQAHCLAQAMSIGLKHHGSFVELLGIRSDSAGTGTHRHGP